MTTLMQRGATWLGGKLKTSAGRSVTYRRGPLTSSAITGWVARNAYDEAGDEGLQTTVVSDDWSFIASELILNSETITPREGDQIIEGTTIYEVLPLQTRPCYERLDQTTNGLLLLIHTKRVGG